MFFFTYAYNIAIGTESHTVYLTLDTNTHTHTRSNDNVFFKPATIVIHINATVNFNSFSNEYSHKCHKHPECYENPSVLHKNACVKVNVGNCGRQQRSVDTCPECNCHSIRLLLQQTSTNHLSAHQNLINYCRCPSV